MLPPIDHPMALSSAGDDAPFTLAGNRCIVVGTEQAGILDIQLDGIRAARDCRVTNAQAIEFRITPLGIERALRIGTANVRERIVVAPQNPAMSVEWQVDSDVEIELGLQSLMTPGVAFFWSEPASEERADSRFFVRRNGRMQLMVAGEAGTADHLGPSRWVRVHSAAAQRREHEWLSARFPDEQLGLALEWAKYRIATSPPDSHMLRALLGVGEIGVVRARLQTLEPAVAFLSLIGQYAATSGDDAFVRAQWPRVVQLCHDNANTLTADTLRQLAATAESIGDANASSDLKRSARESQFSRAAWSDFEEGKTTAAARAWVTDAMQCYMNEKGAWPVGDRGSAAQLITSFVYGLLGVESDATRARLRMRPQIPADWPFLSVENIRIGDAGVSLEFSRAGGVHTYVVSQSAGAYPVRLVFEPTLETPLIRATVDGKPADLNSVPFGERIITPMQILLDDRRVVELSC